MALNLSKIPNLYSIGYVGDLGSGKTLSFVEDCLRLANSTRRPIATNFPLNPKAIKEYCKFAGLHWLRYNAILITEPDIFKLMAFRETILGMDEAAVELFARNFADKSRKLFIDNLVRLRHYRNTLLWAAQGTEQVDIELRRRTNLFTLCRGWQSKYDLKLKRTNLILRQRYYLDKLKFEKFEKLGLDKVFYPIINSGFRFEFNIVGTNEKLLFNCYDSYDDYTQISPSKVCFQSPKSRVPLNAFGSSGYPLFSPYPSDNWQACLSSFPIGNNLWN
jgi:hypothetical protein